MPDAYHPAGTAPQIDRNKVRSEVENGLPNERRRIARALENQAYYDHDADRYQPRREAENEWDYAGRALLQTGLTRLAVDVLCEQQYAPGPSRSFDRIPKEAARLLEATYEEAQIDAVMQRAEALATLNDAAAVEVRCTNDPECPVELQLWGGEEFAVFADPNRPRHAAAVVTIDRVDERTRYKLWFDDVVETYVTDQYASDKTAGARLANLRKSEPNTYGAIPFAFTHYESPVREFWTVSPGHFLAKSERHINHRLSELDEQLQKYKPIGVAINVATEWNPVQQPGRFVRLMGASLVPTGGDFGGAAGAQPDLRYIQAAIDVAGHWHHLAEWLNTAFTAARVPLSAVRMQQEGFASGISLMVEQSPLLTRANRRRPMFLRSETALARLILCCAGGHYLRPDWVAASKALRPVFAWPEPAIPIPDPVRDQLDDWERDKGALSLVQIVQRRHGFSRPQALDYLRQVQEDEEDVEAIAPGRSVHAETLMDRAREAAEGEGDGRQPEPGDPAGDPLADPSSDSDEYGGNRD